MNFILFFFFSWRVLYLELINSFMNSLKGTKFNTFK